MTARVAFVAIGRNEGERLVACLASLKAAGAGAIVYVDSGSTDGSLAAAQEAGAQTIALDMAVPFTAARARNAGLAALKNDPPDFVQFIDGDCVLDAGWLATATDFLAKNPDVAVVCGRRRERWPEASIFNRLCDLEWDTPIGDALACGGDALARYSAVAAVGGYRDGLIAGEEPELCVRLREKGWRIVRLDAEMTLHDAAMRRFSQWWKRAKRAGHAFAEVSFLHRQSPFGIWRAETRRALAWSAAAPAFLALGVFVAPAFLAGLVLYPVQAARLALRDRRRLGDAAPAHAALSVIGKFAEAEGVLAYHLRRLAGRRSGLIEYK